MAKQAVLDQPTLELVRFAAAIALGYEPELVERAEAIVKARVPPGWTEELLLQSLLMVGYPRALIAFAVWRRISRIPAPEVDPDADYQQAAEWMARGEKTCREVYDENYTKLRGNVRQLHPAVDAWMLAEGYGRTIARPGLDLLRRELCIVAQVGVLEAPRQLHSHLRGALNAGASLGQIEAALSVVNPLLSFDQWKRVKEVWREVKESRGSEEH